MQALIELRSRTCQLLTRQELVGESPSVRRLAVLRRRTCRRASPRPVGDEDRHRHGRRRQAWPRRCSLRGLRPIDARHRSARRQRGETYAVRRSSRTITAAAGGTPRMRQTARGRPGLASPGSPLTTVSLQPGSAPGPSRLAGFRRSPRTRTPTYRVPCHRSAAAHDPAACPATAPRPRSTPPQPAISTMAIRLRRRI